MLCTIMCVYPLHLIAAFINISLANVKWAQQPTIQASVHIARLRCNDSVCAGGITTVQRIPKAVRPLSSREHTKNDTHRELRQEICNMNRVWCSFSHSPSFTVSISVAPVRSPANSLLFSHIHIFRTSVHVLAFWGYFRVWNIENFHIFFFLCMAPPTFMCFSHDFSLGYFLFHFRFQYIIIVIIFFFGRCCCVSSLIAINLQRFSLEILFKNQMLFFRMEFYEVK